MTQNIYDDPAFHAQYSQLRRSVEGLAGAPEWPAMQALLPPLAGLRVLDLGCGFGRYARWLREAGAASVLGIDVSERMLARAREETTDPAISYRRETIEEALLDPASLDLVFSSLALHYVADFGAVCEAVARALAAGGSFVFSVEHPIFTAPSRQEWVRSQEGEQTWPLNRYLDEGARRTHWLGSDVTKYHRTTASYVNALIAHGFTIAALDDWGPSAAQIAERPELAEERDRPAFLLVAARR
jgi:SAM-dependent methyltransferase